MSITPTNEVLKSFETAARIYCQRIGQDADAPVPHLPQYAGGIVHNAVDHIPFWHMIAHRLFDLSALLSSLKAAARAEQDDNAPCQEDIPR